MQCTENKLSNFSVKLELNIWFLPLMCESFILYTLQMFNSGAGGAEFKSVHLHELPTYDNLAEASLEKK